MRLVRASWLAAGVLLVAAPAGATGEIAAPARASGATPAAAPFAEAWAKVPASPAARKARNVVVFGGGADVPGFNTNLACCNTLSATFVGAAEALHGAFNQNDKGVWFRDLVSAASANSKGLSYTIKPNAYWYWGGKKVPVTYKDFVYTWQQLVNPANDSVSRDGYDHITGFTHKGLRQITFAWKMPFANWPSLFSGLYPSFALAGMDFNKIWTNCICGNDGQPVSDGPFYLSNYTKGLGTTLKANPFWAGKKQGLAEVDFRFLPDLNTVVESMRSGAVDAIAPSFGTYLLPLKSTPGITFDEIPGYYFEHLQFREGSAKAGAGVTRGSSNVLLRAPWLREAIALGLNRQLIINTTYGQLAGNTKPMNNLIYYSTQTHYRPDFQRWNYDPAKALAIMKTHCAAGTGPPAPNLANTKIWQCSGLPATFNWTWSLAADARTTTEQIAKAELQSIGIQIVDKPLAPNVIFGPNGLPSGDFDIADFNFVTSGDPGDWYDTYRCFGTGNWTGYCSHTVDALLTEAANTLDPAKRASLFQQADAIMATQVPMVPLYERPIFLIHKSNLLGMVASPGPAGPFWNIEDWHWRP